MIRLTDIYAAVNQILKSKYRYKIYGNEVKEGFESPSFFVELVPITISDESVNHRKDIYSITITYFQKKPDEIDNLVKIDEMRELFGYHLKVNNSTLCHITEFEYEFTGARNNILQVSFDIEYMDFREKEKKTTAKRLSLKTETR